MKWIDATRVHRGVVAMRGWLSRAHNQGGKHLLPLLALLEMGAGIGGTAIVFEERPHEFDFWDRYFKLPGDPQKPYFNVLTGRRAEANFPHSNAATIRKNRFFRAWNAATLSAGPAGEAIWSLAPTYAEIFSDKALVKGDDVARVPVVDLAVVMLRDQEFADHATAQDLVLKFRALFPQEEADFATIFEFFDEPSDTLFTATRPPVDYLNSEIASALVPEAVRPPLPAPSGEAPSDELEDEDDPILLQVRELLALGSSGIIFQGTPGSGKSWYARRIGSKLVTDVSTDLFRVQFHPSYGYEDFVEGYRPHEGSAAGFQVADKVFLSACARAEAVRAEGRFVVIIVDEINRGEPGRIFGEILTYLEMSYRDQLFFLPYSGRPAMVPSNLVFLGTMNPFDRSITQLDAAFVRRFDHIKIPPSSEVVGTFLEAAGSFSNQQVDRIRVWFELLQRLLAPQGIGHAYFKHVHRPEHLHTIWRYRIWPACELVLEFDDRQKENLRASFESMYVEVLAMPSLQPADAEIEAVDPESTSPSA